MKTTIDLPRPLLLRVVSRAARSRLPLSRFIAKSLEKELAAPPEPARPPGPAGASEDPVDDPLFESLRAELGL